MDKGFTLTIDEQKLFSKTRAGRIEEVKDLLSHGDVRLNCLDDHGMTPVQHAAYKGNYEMCKLFVDCGADLNINHHDHKYTALMFACLSGNLRVVRLLLENGAATNVINTIKRTASQLAAFVGNHDIVSLINNFVPVEEIHWYTDTHGKETEPKLPLSLAKPLHQLVIQTNINPVHLAMFLQKNTALLLHAKKVTYVLDHLSGVKLNDCANEMVSIKLHHMAFVVRACDRFVREVKKEPPSAHVLESLIKHWIKDCSASYVPMALEKLVRQSIREFPFGECFLFQQFVRKLAPIEVGCEPTALALLTQAVGGHRNLEEVVICNTCGELYPEKKCSVCRSVQYCDRYCQKLHWPAHKLACPDLAKRMETRQEANQQETVEFCF